MSRSLNKVTLIGNVGSDPDIRMTPSGTKVAKFSVATNETFNDRSGRQQERTQWHRLTFFGRLSDVVEQWVKKGDRLYVEGRIEYSQTQTPQGETRYWTDIIVREMIMLGSGGRTPEMDDSGNRPQRSGADAARRGGRMQEPDDDLPF
ncbi:MAG: single-stranded DNA-binding protein [Gammaproteobacteria bacterium]|nr:single-stranded DNA-binding protein [Gammaproteobacteria bacterium]MYC98349.1 single-stranded DNA-binding protein [Gammaproteobacteria bacterium]